MVAYIQVGLEPHLFIVLIQHAEDEFAPLQKHFPCYQEDVARHKEFAVKHRFRIRHKFREIPLNDFKAEFQVFDVVTTLVVYPNVWPPYVKVIIYRIVFLKNFIKVGDVIKESEISSIVIGADILFKRIIFPKRMDSGTFAVCVFHL